MNAKKVKQLRKIVQHAIDGSPHRPAFLFDKAYATGATDKQISRAFDVVLKVRSPVIRHGLTEDIKAFTQA